MKVGAEFFYLEDTSFMDPGLERKKAKRGRSLLRVRHVGMLSVYHLIPTTLPGLGSILSPFFK